jgi:hypothetical protein
VAQAGGIGTMRWSAQVVPIGAPCACRATCPSKRPQRAHLPTTFGKLLDLTRFGAPAGVRSGTCPWHGAEVGTVAQRVIELLIGRLITDEEFRFEFLKDPEKTLADLSEHGLELSRTEVAALVSTDSSLWARTADAIDPRLQKASFKNVVRIP